MTTIDRPETSAPVRGSWYDLVLKDTRPLDGLLQEASPYDSDTDEVAVSRYTSREWHEKERAHLWRKVWQMACREEHLPNVGSYIVYEIAGDSYLVTRTHEGLRAYVNACLHRGRALKTYDGDCSEFRCPFHGFTWRLDGTLRSVPAASEFPRIEQDRSAWSLPEAKVGTWGGFVFINPDPDCEPLEDFLGVLPSHFAGWDFENRYVEAHVGKLLRCNWKVAQEAFIEGYHLASTHPQAAYYVGDGTGAVDVFGNIARQIAPTGTPADGLPREPTEAEILARILDVREGEPLPIPLAEGQTAREAMSTAARDRWRPAVGAVVDTYSDAEMLDHWNYVVFPNFHPWGAFSRIVYRFRPNGDRHDESVFEVMFVTPFSGERPPPAPYRLLGFDDAWTDASELSSLALVMEQDTFNMESVQVGLQTTRRTHLILSDFQEGLLRWRHDLLADWVDSGERS
jgi:phenylpropionate dioxygenase-like ring-hydroxylating dioxygenase large terminal subunit